MSDFVYHLILDRSLYSEPPAEIARKAEAAGVHFFQVREKNGKAKELLATALQVRPFLKRTRLIINGELSVALASGADGIHLQNTNIPVTTIRKKYPGIIIGYSAHTRQELLQMSEAGASYLFLSPIFEPLSKESSLAPLGMEEASSWIQGLKTPVLALGGITVHNIKMFRQRNWAGVAAISLFCENGHFVSHGMVG